MQKIKKPVSILLSLMMVLGLFTVVPFSAGAETVSGTEDNISWSFDAETGLLSISGEGDMRSYGQDREVQTSSTSWIYITNAPWGEYYGDVKLIVIEEGVTSIGDCAFAGLCRNVSASVEVQLPSTLTRIGNRAFQSCNMINKINLPDGLISIGESAFDRCQGLKSIDLPDSLVSIGDYAFSEAGCVSMTIPESVEVVGNDAFFFAATQKITFLGTPELGEGIFYGSSMSRVFVFEKSMQFNYLDRDTLPDGAWVLTQEDIVMIPDGCTYLKNDEVIPVTPENAREVFGDATVTFPEPDDENISWSFDEGTGVLTISGTGDMMDYHKNGAFPTSETQMTVVTSAPWGAFCSDIRSVVIEEGVTSVGDYAFYNIGTEDTGSMMSRIQLPSTIKRIGKSAFYRCEQLTEIDLPEGLEVLEEYAFYGCSKLTGIILPDHLKTIEANTFSACSGLSEVHLPEKLDSIKDYAFSYCRELQSITLPSRLNSIGKFSFVGTSLKKLTIPKSVKIIGTGAFQSVDTIEDVIVLGKPSFGNLVFYHCPSLNQIRFSELQQFQDGAFNSQLGSDTTVFVANGSTYLKNDTETALTADNAGDVFDRAKVKFVISGSDDSVSWMFDEETGALTISGSGEMVDFLDQRYWLEYANDIRSAVIEPGITKVGNYAFSLCVNLESVSLPDSVTSIGEWSFFGCDSLTTVAIPEDVTTIGNHAFTSCDNLKSITIPEKTVNLGSEIFSYCYSLETLTFEGEERNFHEDDFEYFSKKYEQGGSGPINMPDVIFKGNYTYTKDDKTIPLNMTNGADVFAQAHIVFIDAFAGHSISLNGDIGMNYFINGVEGERLRFEWYNKTYEHTLSADDFDASSGYYKVTVNLAAAEMSCPITATCFYQNEQVGEPDVYSARNYADTILDRESDFSRNYISENGEKKYAVLVDLIKKMLDYGAKAQTRFGVTDVRLANTGVDYTMQPVTINHIKTKKTEMEDENLYKYGLNYIGTSILFLSGMTLRHNYAVTDEYLLRSVKDTANFDFVDKGARVCFERKNIPAAQLDVDFTFTLGESTYRYSVLDYCKLVIADENKPQADRELAMATFWYNDAAKAYFYFNDEYEEDII